MSRPTAHPYRHDPQRHGTQDDEPDFALGPIRFMLDRVRAS